MNRGYLLRYNEIALKGANRIWFEERLAHNARRLLERAGVSAKVSRQHSRILVLPHMDLDTVRQGPAIPAIQEALKHLFGLANFSPFQIVPTDLEALSRAAIEETRARIERHGKPSSFRVFTRRTEKALPQGSPELNRLIGSAVLSVFPDLKVDLGNPEFVIGIEVRFERSYLWTEKTEGLGGLPVGTNGRTLCLISGGLDSPVAAMRILRRGSPVSFLHFHGTPFVGEEVLEKVSDLVRIIQRYQPEKEPLWVVPFGKIQEKVALATGPKLRTLLYRRLMLRIGCEIARKIKAKALITGESLGQVASQTVENLGTINEVSTLPILRPLIGFDKEEIIYEARRWETYEASIRPGVDCCTLFADRHPAIRATSAQAQEEEAKFPVENLVREAIDSSYTYTI